MRREIWRFSSAVVYSERKKYKNGWNGVVKVFKFLCYVIVFASGVANFVLFLVLLLLNCLIGNSRIIHCPVNVQSTVKSAPPWKSASTVSARCLST